jgi:GAF domain-containing protein
MMAAAFFTDDLATYGWVSLRALRIWTEHGTAATLIGTAANAAFHAVVQRDDYDAAYRIARRVLALGEARGYEPGTSHARLVLSLLRTWFEPVETSVQASRQAREALLAGGDFANASYTYHQTVVGLLDCAPTLGACLTQVDAALALARRIGAELPNHWLGSYQWLADVLRRDAAAAAAAPADSYESNPLILTHACLTRAIAAAIFGDPAALARHSAVALPLLPVTAGYAMSAMAHPLRGLSLAWQARDADGDERARLLAELDDVLRWLAARAEDAPDNFLHLLRLVQAERAWATGDFRTATFAFDGALAAAASRQRPWHRALVAERAARFYLAHGLEHAGYDLLTRARQEYLDWGATAKVGQLDWAYPALRPTVGTGGEQPSGAPRDRDPVNAGASDLLGILSASQALSSATSVEQLHTRVAEVLGRMTSATEVNLLLWNENRQDWLLAPASDGEHAVPMSVLRYVRRTREPLTVGDATTDDRFARDAYFKNANCCSLLAMPILGQGALQAVLLLENRLIRGAFTVARLDAVELIAGQLAVSLRNARLYAGYRRIADEQAALRRVATLVARAARPEAVFTTVAEETGRLLAADFAILVRYDPQDTLEVVGTWVRTGDPPATPVGGRLPLGGRNVTSLVYQTGRPARIDYDDVSGTIGAVAARDWGLRSSIAVPVNIESRLWGSLVVAFGHEELLPADAEEQLAHFCELVGTAIANADATSEVAASRARIVAAADDARRRIERDLHDGAQQRLV